MGVRFYWGMCYYWNDYGITVFAPVLAQQLLISAFDPIIDSHKLNRTCLKKISVERSSVHMAVIISDHFEVARPIHLTCAKQTTRV